MDNTMVNPQPKKQRGGVATFLLGFLSVMILLGALGGVGYYYLMKSKYSHEGFLNAKISSSDAKEIDALIRQIGVKNEQIKVLTQENAQLKQQSGRIVEKLRYIIKPKAKIVVECYKSAVGKWNLPQECAQTLINNVRDLLNADKKIVALEVSGVVDEKPYRGLSPELKQEGLASFRAKSVIEYLRKALPMITTFEGLSLQEKGKRGYFIRAYYVE